MSEALTLITITMPSAPTVAYAPFATQVVHLTTGDDYYDAEVDLTWSGNVIESFSTFSNEIDMSQGQGAYATSLHGTIYFADSCDGGRLYPLIMNGSIPLIGASVAIRSEASVASNNAPITFYMYNPAIDSEGILSFDLYSKQYLSGLKLCKWQGMREGVSIDVGVVVGNPTPQAASAGRYQGVSVPTQALADAAAVQIPGISTTGKTGNPSVPGSTLYATTTHPYDSPASGHFEFVFPSQAIRDSFYLQYNGDGTSSAKITPNACFLVSDGSNSDIIATSDATGAVTYAYSSTGCVIVPATRVIGSTTYYTLYLTVAVGGLLVSSAATSIQLYLLQQNNPICVGAASLVGFQSKSSTAVEYGLTLPQGIQTITNNVLYFVPKNQTTDGFTSITELDNPQGFVWLPAAYTNTFQSGAGVYSFANGIESVSTKSNVVPTNPFQINVAAYLGDQHIDFPIAHLLNSAMFNFEISKVFVDSYFDVQATATQTWYTSLWKWVFPFNNTQATQSGTASWSASYPLLGEGAYVTTQTYESLEAAVSTGSMRLTARPSTNEVSTTLVSLTENIYQIIIYAVTKLAYGNNPAVVLPGYFPGSTTYTTTPDAAIAEICTLGSIAAKIYVGNTSKYPVYWGEYVDPTSKVNDVIASIAKESWVFVTESPTIAATAPTVEGLEPARILSGNSEDVITEPVINYDYANGSAQYAGAINNVDKLFDMSNGTGYYWSGWQEKDTCRYTASPLTGSTILASATLRDCIACITFDGYVRCSFDEGTTWTVSKLLLSAAATISIFAGATLSAGNGILVATAMDQSSYSYVFYSNDYGRTWLPMNPGTTGKLAGAIKCAYYDPTETRHYIAGIDSTGIATFWDSLDGYNWTAHTIVTYTGGPNISGMITNFAATHRTAMPTHPYTIAYAAQVTGQSYLLTSWGGGVWNPASFAIDPTMSIMQWDGYFHVFVGNTLYTSPYLDSWDAGATVAYSFVYYAQSDDGKLRIGTHPTNAQKHWFSRDSGVTWTLNEMYCDESKQSPGWQWSSYYSTFMTPTVLHTRFALIGDPSLYQLWLTCRNAYLAHGILNSSSLEWKGVYNASDAIDMLFAVDGIDSSINNSRINWICKQPRYAELSVVYNNVATQLTVSAAQRITIPQQRLQDAGLNDNIPTYGIITSVEHNILAGTSTLQIAMPPI